MPKSELFNNTFIPWVLVAGVLSGGLWRTAPAAESGKQGESGATTERTDDATGPLPWIANLRPAMESLDDALGGRGARSGRLDPTALRSSPPFSPRWGGPCSAGWSRCAG
jgi:hypothetical protein